MIPTTTSNDHPSHGSHPHGGPLNAVRLRTAAILACSIVALINTGCVRRTLTINTEPQGALIWLNDEEIGRSPVSTDFLWYGDYDVVARLEGYETLKTHHNIKSPWYQKPGIDFFSEILYPGHIHDERSADFVMEPQVVPDRNELLERASEFRERSLFDEE
ncbi:MAG TPA: PEGA domain-containing protein [Phycisphaerae bacterium]|nr:PEGA domain-containing protein [Phycisphaerae bacterium]